MSKCEVKNCASKYWLLVIYTEIMSKWTSVLVSVCSTDVWSGMLACLVRYAKVRYVGMFDKVCWHVWSGMLACLVRYVGMFWSGMLACLVRYVGMFGQVCWHDVWSGMLACLIRYVGMFDQVCWHVWSGMLACLVRYVGMMFGQVCWHVWSGMLAQLAMSGFTKLLWSLYAIRTDGLVGLIGQNRILLVLTFGVTSFRKPGMLACLARYVGKFGNSQKSNTLSCF